jgi:nitrogen fixation protein NifU and related proteins
LLFEEVRIQCEQLFDMYSKIVQDHFHNPRHVGPLAGATHRGTGGEVGGGPYIVLWLRIEGGCVLDAAYQSYGCPAAIASASVACGWVIDKTPTQARSLSAIEVLGMLDGLPDGKDHCPRLAIAALQSALNSQEG